MLLNVPAPPAMPVASMGTNAAVRTTFCVLVSGLREVIRPPPERFRGDPRADR